MTINVPEKHRQLAHAWVDGAAIEYFCKAEKEWFVTKSPSWVDGLEYRIKKNKVKKWQFVYRTLVNDRWFTTVNYYRNYDEMLASTRIDPAITEIQVLECSMIEIEE